MCWACAKCDSRKVPRLTEENITKTEGMCGADERDREGYSEEGGLNWGFMGEQEFAG